MVLLETLGLKVPISRDMHYCLLRLLYGFVSILYNNNKYCSHLKCVRADIEAILAQSVMLPP